MNKLAKLGTVLIALALAATVTGCSTAEQESEKASPSEVAPLYLEAMRGNGGGPGIQSGHRTDRRRRVRQRQYEFPGDVGGQYDRRAGSPTHRGHAGRPSKVEYTIIDEQVDGENATVTVALRGPGSVLVTGDSVRDDRRADD